MSVPFVTDEIARSVLRPICKASGRCRYFGDTCNTSRCALTQDEAKAVLAIVAPILLAKVQAASEHTADYRIAAAAEALRGEAERMVTERQGAAKLEE